MSSPAKDESSLPSEAHPRSNIPEWKWKGTLTVLVLTTIINGRLKLCIQIPGASQIIILTKSLF